jgi:hypothetical protein
MDWRIKLKPRPPPWPNTRGPGIGQPCRTISPRMHHTHHKILMAPSRASSGPPGILDSARQLPQRPSRPASPFPAAERLPHTPRPWPTPARRSPARLRLSLFRPTGTARWAFPCRSSRHTASQPAYVVLPEVFKRPKRRSSIGLYPWLGCHHQPMEIASLTLHEPCSDAPSALQPREQAISIVMQSPAVPPPLLSKPPICLSTAPCPPPPCISCSRWRPSS